MGVLAFTKIGKYRVDRVAGVGGMGTVYLGFDELMERVVAIKVLHPHLRASEEGEDFDSRFKQEARAAARCMHPNIVAVFDYGTVGDLSYLVMEFVQGSELRDYIKSDTGLTMHQSVEVMLQVLAGLAHAHDNGVVHRDIKPANILMLDDGPVKLTDFGVARLDTSDMTESGNILGTPNYMSPEGLRGRSVDNRGDLFAVGLVLLELICGERLNSNLVDPKTVQEVLEEAALDDPDVLDFQELLHRALREDPEERFQTAEEFREMLRAMLGQDAEIDESIGAQDATVTLTAPPAGLRLVTASPAAPRAVATEQSARFSEDVQQLFITVLAEELGPLATFLVEHHAAASDSDRALGLALARHIDDENRRKAFLAKLDSAELSGRTQTERYRRILRMVFDEPEES